MIAREAKAAGRVQTGFEAFDIAAREAQVLGEQRIAPLAAEEISEDARDMIEALRVNFDASSDRRPPIFPTLAKHPGLFRAQMQLGVELATHGSLPKRERELAVLRVAWLCRSPHEWGAHVDFGKKIGLTGDEVERVTRGSSAPGWDEHDRAVLRGCEEQIGDHAISDETWTTLSKRWNEKQLIELMGLVGSYVMTACIYSTLRFALLEGNHGLSHR